MKTFGRYFIYFGGICLIVFLGLITINFFVEDSINEPVIFIIVSFSLLIFSALMALVFSSFAKEKVIVFPCAEIVNMDEIDKFISDKCKRTEKTEKDGVILYEYKNKINKWVTNPIKIINSNKLIVSIPSYFEEEFKANFFKEINTERKL